MYSNCELISWIYTKWRLTITFLMIMMKIVEAQYSFVQPYDQITIGFPVRPSSRSIDQVLLVYPDRAMIYTPHFRNCNVLDIYVAERKKKPKVAQCQPFGRQRYLVDGLKANTDYMLHLRRKGRRIALRKLPLRTPKKKNKPPSVPWHYVAGTGPGWIDLRWSCPHPVPHHLVTFKVEHWMMTVGMDPVLSYSAHAMNGFVDLDGEVMPRVKPTLPCPQWKSNDIYCLVLTGMVFPRHIHYNQFTDWVVQITTYPVVPQRPGLSTVDLARPSLPFRAVVRSWDCDTTMFSCPKLLRSVPFHKEYTYDSTEKAHWGRDKGDIYIYPSNEPTFQVVTANLTNVETYENEGLVHALREWWPVFLILCLLVLLVVLPLAFHVFKRNARDHVIGSWYGWSSPDGRVNYAVAMPEGVTHLTAMKDSAYQQRVQELDERRSRSGA